MYKIILKDKNQHYEVTVASTFRKQQLKKIQKKSQQQTPVHYRTLMLKMASRQLQCTMIPCQFSKK